MSGAAASARPSRSGGGWQTLLADLKQVRASILILLALLIFNALFTPYFLSVQTLNVNLTQVATIIIVAMGMTLVIATGGVDLSVGSLMAISGVLAPLIFLNPAFAGALWLGLFWLLPCRCWWPGHSASSTACSSRG